MNSSSLKLETFLNNTNKLLILFAFFILAIATAPVVKAEKSPQVHSSIASNMQVPTLNMQAQMVVYKSPTCGCCGDWVDHMNAVGFMTKIQHPQDLNAIKETLGVAPVYQACHTATMQDYTFEGHIPADVIQKFLGNKPSNALGLAVPGMPMGSPGMDTNGNFRPYQVLQLNKDGSSTPYASVSARNTVYLENK
jgi:hypothetical protein